MLYHRFLPIFFCSLLVAFGCSRVPDIPKTPGAKPGEIEQVILTDSISVADVRKIFAALNKNGRLNSLKPWMESSDDALSEFGALIERHFYEEAFSKQGILTLLEDRAERKGFSDWHNRLQSWALSKTYTSERLILNKVLSHPTFPKLIEWDVSFLSPKFLSVIENVRAKALLNYQKLTYDKMPSPPNTTAIASDLMKLIATEGVVEKVGSLSLLLSKIQFGSYFMKGFSALSQTYSGNKAGEGFALGISRHIESIPKLLKLNAILDSKSDGLFEIAWEKLHTDQDLLRLFADRLQPALANSVFYQVKNSIEKGIDGTPLPKTFWVTLSERVIGTGTPSTEFSTLFTLVRSGIENLTSLQSTDILQKEISLNIHALIITEWIQSTLVANAATIKTLPEEEFQKTLWETSFTSPNLTFSLVDVDATGKPLSFSSVLSKELDSIGGLDVFKTQITRRVLEADFGSKTYTFVEFKNIPYKEGLKSAIQKAGEIRPAFEPAPLFITLFNALPSFKIFETGNMAAMLDGQLSLLSGPQWETLRELLFKDLKLGNLSENDRNLILQLYTERQDLTDKLNGIFDTVQVLDTVSETASGIPSLFDVYLSWLRQTPSAEVSGVGSKLRWVSSSLTFLNDIHLFDKYESRFNLFNRSLVPYYPALYTLFLSPSEISYGASYFTLLNEEEEAVLLETLEAALGKVSGNETTKIEKQLQILKEIALANPLDFRVTLTHILDLGWQAFPSKTVLNIKERHWILKFITSGDFAALYDFLNAHSSRDNLKQLIRELKTLTKNGALKDATVLLKQIKNDRIHFLATVLQSMLDSGEWEQLLDSFLMIL